MRIITGGIMHETHTFSAEPTTIDSFAIARGDELFSYAGTNHSCGGVIDEARERDIDLVPTFFGQAISTDAPDRATFETMLDELTTAVKSALPADGVVLTLHGAMVAEGYLDADSEITRRVREVVGPKTPIAVTLDLHANFDRTLVDLADIITIYDTYPHVDIAERAREAVKLLAETIDGKITPTRAVSKPPLLPVPQVMHTSVSPFKMLFDRAHALEESGEALSVSIAGGFAYADAPETGISVLAVTDNDPEKAQQIVDEIAHLAWDLRHEMIPQNVSAANAVAEAISYPEGPVVLVDVGDNIGGGTTGDGTVLLAELLKQGAQEATICIADAEAARTAIAAGISGTVTTMVGGKVDRLHGEPVQITGCVVNITDGKFVHEGPENRGVPADMGPTAVVRVDGVNLILTSLKFAPGDLQQLRSVGIAPEQQKILVVKAAVRWRGGYGPITKHAILVDTPGLGSVDLTRFDYHHLRRPLFPLDQIDSW
ncbi:MAG: M81 family metallopeptidase [Thermomicrobiales bacterium]|nr:M81 family metallopeptidase [Thermomicrobiales bacterium]